MTIIIPEARKGRKKKKQEKPVESRVKEMG
jgi:hypothetical protein